MKKILQLCGLGNAIVDIFLEVSDDEFAALGFERGTMRLVDLAEQKTLLDRYQKHEPRLVSGGSVANSTIAFSQLGGDAGFIGCVGDDRYGLFYASEFEELGIDIGNPIIVNEATGTCVCVITPDAERTMRTCLAVSSHLAARHVDEERIKNSEWLFIEGYVFANPATGQTAIREAIRLAKKHNTRIALTCSDAFVVNVFGDAFNEALQARRPALRQRSRGMRPDENQHRGGSVQAPQGGRSIVGRHQRPARRLHPPRPRRAARARFPVASRRT